MGDALTYSMDLGHYHVVLDMTDVEYISSGFLRVLVSTQKEAKRFNRGDVYLASPTQRIQDVLKLAGLSEMFKTFATPKRRLEPGKHASVVTGSPGLAVLGRTASPGRRLRRPTSADCSRSGGGYSHRGWYQFQTRQP